MTDSNQFPQQFPDQSPQATSDGGATSWLSRRDLLLSAAATAGAAAVGLSAPIYARAQGAPSIVLPPLPYAIDALAPVLSADALGVHYGKHHKAYVDNLARLVAGTAMESASLVDIVRSSAASNRSSPLFNNAAQAWNHAFFWTSLSPKGGGTPPKVVADAISGSFGAFAAFREQFVNRAVGVFGSGWLWIVWSPKAASIQLLETFNADTPVASDGAVPLAVIDVWEHSYYIDYRNQRRSYVEAVFDKLMDWGAVADKLAVATASKVKPSA